MAGVNFYLKKAEETTGLSLIYLQYKYSGHRLVYTFNQTINPKHWDSKKQRVKATKQTTTADGKYLLNDLLDNLERELLTAYNKEVKNGIPNPSTLKQYLQNFIRQNNETEKKPGLYELIDRFISNEIKHKGRNKADNTIDKYKTVKSHLQEFETKTRYKIDFDTITLDFFYKYLTFLQGKKLATNTIAKDVQVIKAFMNEAIDQSLTTNLQHKNKKFTASWEEIDAVYLSEQEILKLYEFDLSNNKRLEGVRDLFVFGCCVGLRYGDYSDIRPENIIKEGKDHYIKMNTQKTGGLVIIPCSPLVMQIFKKYEHNPNKLPESKENQPFNRDIKEASKLAGMTEKGRLIDKPGMELWECISSHTARRSFATNLYLEGYPTIEIMKITEHKTEKAFMKYIRVSKLDAAKRLSKHMQMRWSEKIMKVAG